MRITNIALLLLLPFAADALHLQVAADKGKEKDAKPKTPEEKPEKKPEDGDATESEQDQEAAESTSFQANFDLVWNVVDKNKDGIIDKKEIIKL